jgi:hypothetical protein
MIATAAAVTAALAAGSGVAVASAAGGKPGAPATAAKAAKAAARKPGGPSERAGHDAIVAAVARELQLSTARVSSALRPLFAAGHADTSSPAFAAAARAIGVSTSQLTAALMHSKESLAGAAHPGRIPGGAKSGAAERAGHDAIVAAVARELHVSTARVGAALRPLFAAGRADLASPAFAAAARALGVSTSQLTAALVHGKQSLAAGS